MHNSMRDKIFQVQLSFNDSLRVRIRRSRTKMAEEFKTRRKVKVRTRKLKINVILFDSVRSKESYNLYCTTLSPGAGHWWHHHFQALLQPTVDLPSPQVETKRLKNRETD